MKIASAPATAAAQIGGEGEPAAARRCARPAGRGPARRSASRRCSSASILAASLSTQTHVVAEIREAGAGNQARHSRSRSSRCALRILAGLEVGARVIKASRRGEQALCSATRPLPSRRSAQKERSRPEGRLLIFWRCRRRSGGAPSYQPEPGPKVISTRRFCGSRTPSAVSTSGRLSPNASVVMTPSGTPRPAR